MESRIRRYFTFRKLSSKPLPSTILKEELDAIGVPYENNPKSRAPTFSLTPQKRDAVTAKEDPGVSALHASLYESTIPGAPPVFGATPIKGNGPVKLQTSRRLSSGELLTTTQEHNRTLADIRDGEYIVGGKESNRNSKTMPIRQPMYNTPSSPRASFASAPPTSFSHRERSPRPARRGSSTQVPDPRAVGSALETLAAPPSIMSPRTRKSRPPSLKRALLSRPTEIPLPSSPGSPPMSGHSLLSRGEEQNATVQALWKAEYARLVNIYGQDGVDRNIAELNKDVFGHDSENRPTWETGRRKSTSTANSPLRPSTETIVPPIYRSPRASMNHESPLVDNTSDESSVKVPSLLSSEESSSYTRRTSIFDADVPTTREEVSRIVENMRKNYLSALEAKSEKSKADRSRFAQRSSSNYPSTTSVCTPVSSSRLGRQSWHASTSSSTGKEEKPSKKRAKSRPSRPKTPRDTTSRSLETAVPKASPKGKPALHRADSTTLGSFFPAKKAERNAPPRRAGPLPTSTPEKFAIGSKGNSGELKENRPVSSISSPEILALETDDFDIFYRDLAQDFDPFPCNTKPVIPTIHLPHGEQVIPDHEDAAPAPPDIDWTPRKGSLIGVI